MADLVNDINTIRVRHDFSSTTPAEEVINVDHANGTVGNLFNAVRAEVFNEYERNLLDIVNNIGNIATASFLVPGDPTKRLTIGAKIAAMDLSIESFQSSTVVVKDIANIIGNGIIDLKNSYSPLHCNIDGDNVNGYTMTFMPGKAIADTYFYVKTNSIPALAVPDLEEAIYSVGTINGGNIENGEVYNTTDDLTEVSGYYVLPLPFIATYRIGTHSVAIQPESSSISYDDNDNIVVDFTNGNVKLKTTWIAADTDFTIAYRQHYQREDLIAIENDEELGPTILIESSYALPVDQSTTQFRYNTKREFYVEKRAFLATDTIPLYVLHVNPVGNYVVPVDGSNIPNAPSYITLADDDLVDIRQHSFGKYDPLCGLISSSMSLQDDGLCKTPINTLAVTNIAFVGTPQTTTVRKIEIGSSDVADSLLFGSLEYNEQTQAYDFSNANAYAPTISQPMVISYFTRGTNYTVPAHSINVTYDGKTLPIYIPSFSTPTSATRIRFFPSIDGTTYSDEDHKFVSASGIVSPYLATSQIISGTGIKSEQIQNGAITTDKLGMESFITTVTGTVDVYNTVEIPFDLDQNIAVFATLNSVTDGGSNGVPTFRSVQFGYQLFGRVLQFVLADPSNGSHTTDTYSMRLTVLKNAPHIRHYHTMLNSTYSYFKNNTTTSVYNVNFNDLYSVATYGSSLVQYVTDSYIDTSLERFNTAESASSLLHIDEVCSDMIYKSFVADSDTYVITDLPVENKADFLSKTTVLVETVTGTYHRLFIPKAVYGASSITVYGCNGKNIHLLKVNEA